MSSIKEIDAFTKQIFTDNAIVNSSQFTVFAYYLHKKFYTKLSARIKPILKIEHLNVESTWTANAIHSHDACLKMDAKELYDCMIAYRLVLDYFLNDEVISKLFRMDETDSAGWRIYKELDSKYIWCKRRIDVKNYQLEKLENV